MTTFPGVVTLNDDNVPVMVGLDAERITLVSGEISIGEWLAGEYEVIDLGSGTFVIEADKDSIPFLPDDPGSFARGLHREPVPATVSDRSAPMDSIEIKEGPPPKSATLVAFWLLVALTTALGIWAATALF
ncbi:MAG TPA: hypothetical protein VLA91_16870 [Acidimicrobiia bacterium]|nr:hypothetical protein [Acidimicrobiia bacterium]